MIDQQSILEVAIKNEKDRKIKERLKAVRFVLVSGYSIDDATEAYCVTAQCIKNWVQWYKDDGIDGLRDLPRNGRPASIPMEKLSEFIVKLTNQVNLTPQILQEEIHKRFGRHFHITYIRKIMHQYGMSAKSAQKYHINHASISAVRSWQQRIKKRILRLEKGGFVIAMADEAFFIRDVKAGRKYWSLVAKRIFLPYTGRHESLAVYGTITIQGEQLFRIYDKFNAVTFVEYLKELHWKYGKIALILDRASVHKSKKVKEYLAKNPDVKLIWLPKGSPYLNMIEQCWKISKHVLLVSEYYAMFSVMNNTVSQYFRTTKFKLDIVNYIFRNPVKMFTNF